MNETIQTLIRAILKVGGGYMVSMGIVNDAQAETLIAAVAVIVGIVWGILHKKSKTEETKPIELKKV